MRPPKKKRPGAGGRPAGTFSKLTDEEKAEYRHDSKRKSMGLPSLAEKPPARRAVTAGGNVETSAATGAERGRHPGGRPPLGEVSMSPEERVERRKLQRKQKKIRKIRQAAVAMRGDRQGLYEVYEVYEVVYI